MSHQVTQASGQQADYAVLEEQRSLLTSLFQAVQVKLQPDADVFLSVEQGVNADFTLDVVNKIFRSVFHENKFTGLASLIHRFTVAMAQDEECQDQRRLVLNAACGNQSATIAMKMSKQLDVKINGITALELAASLKCRKAMLLLIKHGAAVGIERALAVAAEESDVELIKLISQRFADLDISLMLRSAARNGSIECIRILTSWGSKIDPEQVGLAIEAAAGQGHKEVVRHLIAQFPSVEVQELEPALVSSVIGAFPGIFGLLLCQRKDLSIEVVSNLFKPGMKKPAEFLAQVEMFRPDFAQQVASLLETDLDSLTSTSSTGSLCDDDPLGVIDSARDVPQPSAPPLTPPRDTSSAKDSHMPSKPKKTSAVTLWGEEDDALGLFKIEKQLSKAPSGPHHNPSHPERGRSSRLEIHPVAPSREVAPQVQRFYQGHSLHEAAKQGDVIAIEELIKRNGVSIDALNDEGFTALAVAAQSGQEQSVGKLDSVVK